MSYYKMHIDELHSDNVFCEFREITKEGKGPMKIKSFPLDKMAEVIPKVKEMVAGDIIGVYYEKKGKLDAHTEIQWLDGEREQLSTADQDWCLDIIKRESITVFPVIYTLLVMPDNLRLFLDLSVGVK